MGDEAMKEKEDGSWSGRRRRPTGGTTSTSTVSILRCELCMSRSEGRGDKVSGGV